jgi:hypothetical protein
MNLIAKVLTIVLIVSFVLPAYSQEAPKQAGINLKVGESFYFEGNIQDKAADEKEESMAEIQKTPFYKSTWFITVVSVVVIAGAAVGIYFGTRTEEPEGNVIVY